MSDQREQTERIRRYMARDYADPASVLDGFSDAERLYLYNWRLVNELYIRGARRPVVMCGCANWPTCEHPWSAMVSP